MNDNIITITIDKTVYDEFADYADACEIDVAELATALIHQFLRFQKSEMDEVYLNDDGAAWEIQENIRDDYGD